MSFERKCIEREQLFAFAKHLLGGEDENDVRAHLAECFECRSIIAQYERVDAVLDEWPAIDPSPGFEARVRAAVARWQELSAQESAALSPFFGWRWSQALASACLVALLAAASFWIFQGQRSHTSWLATRRAPAQAIGRGEVRQPPAERLEARAPVQPGEVEISLCQNLAVLEDYDMLANFDVLSELPRGNKKIAN